MVEDHTNPFELTQKLENIWSAVERRRDALDAPQQMILSFPFFFLFPLKKKGLPSSLLTSFPPSLSRHVTPCKGGKTTSCLYSTGKEMATVRWLEEQQAVPPPIIYFTTLFRQSKISSFFNPVEGFIAKIRIFNIFISKNSRGCWGYYKNVLCCTPFLYEY